jgi:hypothetical protein
MSDRYLWDRSGKPDPEIERLEKLLAPFALESPKPSIRPGPRYRWLAVAAAVLIVLGAALWLRAPRGQRTSWQLVRQSAGSGEQAGEVYTGQRIATDDRSRIQLRSDSVGRLELEPGSELYFRESTAERQLLSLHRGTLHALIWAPPSRFAVDTPGARAVDLGCAYTLQTQSNGDGLVQVEMGWVAFDHRRVESFIPAGAACRVYRKSGPGVPYFEDATDALRKSLAKWETTGESEALTAVLGAARSHDGLTVWHLLGRVNMDQRGRVFDRFVQLTPKAPVADRQAVVRADRSALDRCWNALDLGETSWWRTWKQGW